MTSYATASYPTRHTSSRMGAAVRWLVVHTTEGNATLPNAAAYLASNSLGVSAHELVGDGVAYIMARDEVATHHAGAATARLPSGETGAAVNRASWGIEIHNRAGVPPTEGAYRVAVERLAEACKRLNLAPDRIIAHRDVDPSRRTDPTGVSIPVLRADVLLALAGKVEPPPVPKVSIEAAARAAWRVEALARASRGDAGAAEALALALRADGPQQDVHDALVTLALPPLYEARDR